MGVPKFYRWTSERYPCLSQVVREHQIPEFDNLYLDMNGIIHVCSHPNDNDPHFRISEADIFKNIFHYIEVLFRIIKPQKNFFMAVDGVAPRAKMNQQRGRRFRTAKETEDNIKRAIQKGERLPDEDQFDSNCITPGTDFMARLNSHLQYFVNLKVSTDPLWQNCNVYLSGHDVPGEGEHKIMDFIRHEKSRDDYDPNTRHCLYGLDADLIVLGLVSHEPHMSLLREEVRFGKQSKRVTKPEETVFHLLHLSLMREYLDFEFSALKDALPFQYDLERIIDDWVLLGFLVGNDFVPHLPNMHINHDALPTLYKVYIETMPTLDGYLHDGGFLNLARFQKYLQALSQFDRSRFEDLYADMKWLEGKTGRAISQGKKKKEKKGLKFSQLVSQVDDDILFPVRNPFMALADLPNTGDSTATDDARKELETKDNDELESLFSGLGFKDGEGGEELFELEFKQNKRAYYIEKFEEPTADERFVDSVAYEYILALQWILHYYFNGVQSWSWYYPFHYSPFISDLINIEAFDLKLDKGTPFRPFEQLLAVLPAYSRGLLPQAFQSLMVMDSSPIIDYYPATFKTDLNGKQQDWEAVVLIPFIKEERLLAAMEPHYSRLTDEEKVRNSYGSCLKFRFSKDLNFKFASSYPGVFADIDVCRASCTKIGIDEFRIDIKNMKKGLCENVLQDIYFPGFPTFSHIHHDTQLRKVGVRVFSYASKSNSMVVSIRKSEEKVDAETVKEMVGKVVHIEWPYMVEGLVTAISDKEKRFIYKQEERVVKEEKMTDVKIKDVLFWMDNVHKKYIERKGIDPGEVDVLVEAKLLKGIRYICGPKGKVTLEKEWADTHQFYPLQAVVQDLKVQTSVSGPDSESLERLFNVGSRCFMMASPHYGCSGEVLEVDKDASRVRVSLSVPKEPDISSIIFNKTKLSDCYYSVESTARKVGLSTRLLLKVAGNLIVNRSKKIGEIDSGSRVNIGLRLKLSGRNREVLGYARRAEAGWSFSESAIDVLRAYIQRFPKLFKKLSTLPDQEWYSKSDLFPEKNGDGSLQAVVEYLKSLPYRQIDPVKCGGRFLDKNIISAITDAVEEVKKLKEEPKSVKVKVKPHVLFKATQHFGNLVPDPSVDYLLFDRVVNVRDNLAVPLGYRGTIVGVHEVRLDEKDEHSPTELNYEVVFDEEFLGGLKLRCDGNRGAYMTNSSMLNISFGARKELTKKGMSPDSITKLQEKAEPKEFVDITPLSASSRYQSGFTPPTSRIYSRDNTPTGRPKDDISSRYFGSGSSQGFRMSSHNSSIGPEDDLKTPGYWLRSYRVPRDQSTPNSSRSHYSPSPSIKNDKRTPKSEKPEGDVSFQDMWMKLYDSDASQKTPSSFTTESRTQGSAEKIVQDSDPVASSKSVDEEGTALLQKLLHINIPKQQQQHQEKELEKETDESKYQLTIPGDFQKGEPRESPNTDGSLMNILFQEGSAPPQPMIAPPASPPSPFVQGSPIPPTKSLQNWCFQNRMPSPTYTYSSTPQGIHAVVNVGSIFRCGGLMCRTKEEAIESAALFALKNLLHMQAQVQFPNMPILSQTNWPSFGMGHRPTFTTPSPHKSSSPHSQRWVSPDQFVGGARLRMECIESNTSPLSTAHGMVDQQQHQQHQHQHQHQHQQHQLFQQISPQFPQMLPSMQQVTRIRHPSVPHLQQQLHWEHGTLSPNAFHPVAHLPSPQVRKPSSQMSQATKHQGDSSDSNSMVSSGRGQVERLNKEQASGRLAHEIKTMEKGSVIKHNSPAFIPLQVNRANLAMEKKLENQKKQPNLPIDSALKEDEQPDLINLNVTEGDDSSKVKEEIRDSTNFAATGAQSNVKSDKSLKDQESKELKPRKVKPILLSPSFFAAKKE